MPTITISGTQNCSYCNKEWPAALLHWTATKADGIKYRCLDCSPPLPRWVVQPLLDKIEADVMALVDKEQPR